MYTQAPDRAGKAGQLDNELDDEMPLTPNQVGEAAHGWARCTGSDAAIRTAAAECRPCHGNQGNEIDDYEQYQDRHHD
jgi:hypothetical protein